MVKGKKEGRSDHIQGSAIKPSTEKAAADLGKLSFEEAERAVRFVQDSLGKGEVIKGTFEDLGGMGMGRDALEVVLDMAKTRRYSERKFSDGAVLFFTSEGLRWATPEPAAVHCARRLESDLCIDASCGQGGQSLFLGIECDRVIAYDVDPLNCLITEWNARAMRLHNIEVFQTDCLASQAVGRAERDCLVFSDPARPSGSPERTLDELLPNPGSIITAYSSKASGFCFELPPYMDIDGLDKAFEAEYISLDGRLNRLNVYIGVLAHNPRSVVILPEGYTISGEPDLDRSEDAEVPFPERFIFELDPALVKAGLISRLTSILGVRTRPLKLDNRRFLLLSDIDVGSEFFAGRYEVLGFANGKADLRRSLSQFGAGKVTPRYVMDPKGYWRERNELEGGLEGDVWVYLFKKGQYIIARRSADTLTDGIKRNGLPSTEKVTSRRL